MTSTLRRRLVAPFAACCVVLSSYPTVSANQITRRDGDDTRSFLDIAWIKHEHERLDDGRRRIRHTIATHDPWPARLLRPGCSEITISIDAPGRYILFYWDGELKARMGRRQLAAWRPDGKSVAVRLRPRLLGGNDRSYRWRARTLATKDGRCNAEARGYEDLAPNARWIRHDLG